MNKKLLSVLLVVSSSFSFSMTSEEITKKFCSEERVSQYKIKIKEYLIKAGECFKNEDYLTCKKKYNINFEEKNKEICYIVGKHGERAREKCLEYFRKGEILKAEEEFVFPKFGMNYFTKIDKYLDFDFECNVSSTGKLSLNGKQYVLKGKNFETKNKEVYRFSGNLYLTMNMKYSVENEMFGAFMQLGMIHKDKNPGKYKNFENTEVDDLEEVTINFSPIVE